MDNLEKLEKAVEEKAVASVVKASTDNPDYRKNAQLELSGKKVDIQELQSQIKEIKENKENNTEFDFEQTKEELAKVKEELKNVQMTDEALKGVLGQLCIFVEAILPEIQKTAGNHQSFFQIQQMVMIGKTLAAQPMPEAIKKELENAKSNKS